MKPFFIFYVLHDIVIWENHILAIACSMNFTNNKLELMTAFLHSVR